MNEWIVSSHYPQRDPRSRRYGAAPRTRPGPHCTRRTCCRGVQSPWRSRTAPEPCCRRTQTRGAETGRPSSRRAKRSRRRPAALRECARESTRTCGAMAETTSSGGSPKGTRSLQQTKITITCMISSIYWRIFTH